MNIIGESKNLVGLNIKVNDNIVTNYTYEYDAGKVFKIHNIHDAPAGLSSSFFVDEHENHAVDINDAKIVLDEVFFDKLNHGDFIVVCGNKQEQDEYNSWLFSISDTDYDDPTNFDYNTIITYNDCVLPAKNTTTVEDFMKTDDFNEFVKYWKEHEICVVFKNIHDRMKFTKNFDNMCQTISNIVEHSKTRIGVVWHISEWVYFYSKDWVSINFEDLENWREILLENKESKPDYHLLKNITLKDIMKMTPNAVLELDTLVKDLLDSGYNASQIVNNEVVFEQETFKNIDLIMDNIELYILNGFVKEVKEFKPFDLTFRIKTPDDLLNMYHRMNATDNEIKHGASISKYEYKDSTERGYFYKCVEKEMCRLD